MEEKTTDILTPQEEFETLMAAHLCEELDDAGEQRFRELLERNPEWDAMHQRYTAVHNLIARVPPEELEKAFRGGRRLSAARARLPRLLLLAAAGVLLAVGVSAIFFALPGRSGRTLAFPHGRCTSDGTVMRSGDRVGKSVESGADSFCDVKIRDGGQVAARVFPNSALRFHSDPTGLHIQLERGRALFDVGPRGKRAVEVHTAGHTVRILGTRLTVAAESGGAEVELLEGRAQVRSAAYLENVRLDRQLPASVVAVGGRQMPALFETRVTTLEPGRSVRLRRVGLTEGERLRLSVALDRAQGDLPPRGVVSPDQAARFVKTVADNLKSSPPLQRALEGSKLEVQTETITARRRWQLERSFRGLAGGRSPAPGTADRNQTPLRPADGAGVLSALKEKRPSKLLYRIHLKDGRVLTGIVEQEGSQYRLSTDQGDLRIHRDQVKNLELFLDE